MLDLLLQSGIRPTWQWSALSGVTPSGSTFTRGSAGWYFNSSGVLTQASSNVARFDYDPATLSPLGYLAEMQSTNGLVRSEAFDNGSWTKQNVTVTADQSAAPDGATTMDKVTETAISGGHEIYQALTLASDTYVPLSVFAKAGTGRDKIFINLQGAGGNWATAVFDLATGTVSQTGVGGTSGTIASTQIQNVGGGIYRCGLIAKLTGANPLAVFGIASLASGNTLNSGGEVSYLGDITKFLYLWGAQADSAGVGVTSYIPTAGSTVTRSQDILSLPLTSLPGWNASRGGVLVATYRLHTILPSTTGFNGIVAYIYKTDFNNSVMLTARDADFGGAGRSKGIMYSGSASQFNLDSGSTATAFTRRKQALGWSTSRGAMAIDGGAIVGSSGSFALPVAPDTMDIGRFGSHGLQGTLESVAYYAGARPDAFVQAVSR